MMQMTDEWRRREAGSLRPEQVLTGSIYPKQHLLARTRGMTRILVMRHWPRGFTHDMFHIYASELAPSAPLLHAYIDGALHWREFAARYCVEVSPRLPWWRAFLAHQLPGDAMPLPIMLLCHEHDASVDEAHVRCHRRLLRQMFLGLDPEP